uniref:(northern house mosquito) hypothetical protein n=1 Tax=Culex pipiens TaxID=7175 RepID=A0A8D8KAV4_CULPI
MQLPLLKPLHQGPLLLTTDFRLVAAVSTIEKKWTAPEKITTKHANDAKSFPFDRTSEKIALARERDGVLCETSMKSLSMLSLLRYRAAYSSSKFSKNIVALQNIVGLRTFDLGIGIQ